MTCSVCGHQNRLGARFCDNCGHRLEGSSAATGGPSSSPAAEPISYTPAHLAERIMLERGALEGERRTVTVLFADAVGSTPLAERLGEEEMYTLLQGCFARMLEAVHHYEGYVVQYTGDGIMALFGAPIAHEGAERRAVGAALRMQRALEEYADEVRRRHPVECRFRVGLNTGPVVVGRISDALAMDFTAVGDTVNLAARMEQVAEPGAVYLTESTYRSVADYVDCEALGHLPVKGKAKPVATFRALRERPSRTRLEVAAQRGLAPFVGREEELTILEDHLSSAVRSHGRVVLVSGDAGIGKSRLLLELRRRLDRRDVGWLEGHCISYGRNIPYLPVIELVRRAFAVEEGDVEGRVIERLEHGTAGWDEAAREALTYLRNLLRVDPDDPRLLRMDPRERRAGILDALRALVVQESRQRPLIVVVEDLHWIDEASRTVVAALVDVVPSRPVLLVLTHRLEHRPTFGESANSTTMVLRHLDVEEGAALVCGMLGNRSLPAEVQRLIEARAEGNPFYMEEVTRSLLEAGVLARSNGSYAVQRPLDTIRIPGSIEEVILSRIDRLEPPARGALQLASVIGREFTARLLRRVSDLEAQLDEILGELMALELIREKARLPELAYAFKHALTQDVTYSTLLRDRRRSLHRVVAAAIEELHTDRLAEQYETLAHHWYEAEVWDKALRYLVKAGDKAAEAFANREALAFYDRALEVADRLGDGRTEATVAERECLIDLTVVDLPAALTDAERMRQAGRRLGDRRIEGRALARRGRVELVDHDFEAAEATFRAALAVGGEHDDVRFLATYGLYYRHAALSGPVDAQPFERVLREMAPIVDDQPTVAMWTFIAMLLERMAGDFELALERARRWREMTGSGGVDSQGLAQVLWAEALTLTDKGHYEEALRIFLRADAMTERMGDAFRRGRVLNSIGWLYNELENHDEALSWNSRAVQFAKAYPAADAEMESNARLNLGDTFMALGRLDEAAEQFAWVERVVHEHTPKAGILWRYSQHLLHSYGELRLERGQPEQALHYADDCLSRAQATAGPKYVVKARRLKSQALITLGGLGDAEEELLLALDVAKQLGNPPQLWKTHAGIGVLYRAQGRMDAARQAYLEAFSVIERVADSLTDTRLRGTFLRSRLVQSIRRAADAPE